MDHALAQYLRPGRWNPGNNCEHTEVQMAWEMYTTNQGRHLLWRSTPHHNLQASPKFTTRIM